MNFFCFSFALNQKYRAANLLRLIAAKSVPKYALSKTASKIILILFKMVFERLARFKVTFTTLSIDVLATEKSFAEVAT